MDLRGALAERRLIILAGKGGVGRTTVAASLALALARRGRRVLLAQVKAGERLSVLLDGPAIGSEIVQVLQNLWAVNMTPASALHEYGVMVLRYESVYRAVFENRFSRAFFRAVPGLDDYAMLGKAWYHTTEVVKGRPKYDVVLLDGAATGQLAYMLGLPAALLRAVSEGPLRKDATQIQALLTDPSRTAVVLVTLAEELPAREAVDLAGRLGTLGIRASHLVPNQVWPDELSRPGPARDVLEALEGEEARSDERLRPILGRATHARDRRRLNEHYLDMLSQKLPLPQIRLPLLFAPQFGLEQTETLSRVLEGSHEI